MSCTVQTTASEAEIKKAYYVKARQCHPDKKKDDELANEQFQQLGEVCFQFAGPAATDESMCSSLEHYSNMTAD
jgi:hypothetical protein